jgi:hypothetical protein
MSKLFITTLFLLTGLNLQASEKGFLDYCNAELPEITREEAITVGYLKLSLKYKGPMPFKISTKRVYGENGEVLREMEGVNSFFWYAHPSDFKKKFSSTEEVKAYLISVFNNKSNCERWNEKLQTRVENMELSMPPILGRDGKVIPFKLTTLAPLNGALKLKRLNVIGHNVSGDMPVLNLPSLEELKMTKSGIRDITFLKNLKTVKILALGRNNIRDISALENLTNLEDLELYDNKVKDLSPLRDLTNIFYLSLGGNYLVDLSPLSNLVKLNFLSVQSNLRITGQYGVEDITPLKNLVSLRELTIRDNRVSDISALGELRNLVRLNVSRNKFTDCSVLGVLKATNPGLVVTNVRNKCK